MNQTLKSGCDRFDSADLLEPTGCHLATIRASGDPTRRNRRGPAVGGTASSPAARPSAARCVVRTSGTGAMVTGGLRGPSQPDLENRASFDSGWASRSRPVRQPICVAVSTGSRWMGGLEADCALESTAYADDPGLGAQRRRSARGDPRRLRAAPVGDHRMRWGGRPASHRSRDTAVTVRRASEVQPLRSVDAHPTSSTASRSAGHTRGGGSARLGAVTARRVARHESRARLVRPGSIRRPSLAPPGTAR